MLNRARIGLILVLSVGFLTAAAQSATSRGGAAPDLTVHEWGTFTTVAGEDGRAIEWLPLGGPTDLPCFVEHFQNNPRVKILTGQTAALDYETARAHLWGKVRMETPVLYFYAPKEMSANVRVGFPRGLMTEWYPHATVTQPNVNALTLRDPDHASVIEWPDVRIAPNARPVFPVGSGSSHYYAARETDAAPVLVNRQRERFLFYRGVASFDVPLAATALAGGAIRLINRGPDDIPAVVLFEKRGSKLGYRIHGALRGETTLAAPALRGDLPALRGELEVMLVAAGLFPREARAMIATWGDSWFEEGTRVFYIVPPRAVDAILPLRIDPKPASVTRVFVGRMEVITPALQRSVERAIYASNGVALERYARFLGPITDRILSKGMDATRAARIREVANAAFVSYLGRMASCE